MKSISLCLLFTLASVYASSQNVEEGKTLFTTRCTSCHTLEKNLVGPALNNIDKKYPVDWFVQFVISSQGMIAAGEERAVKVFNEFNKIPMPDHKDLTEAQVKNIYEYIKSASTSIVAAAANAIPRPAELKPSYTPITEQTWVIYVWIVCSVLLTIALYVKVGVNNILH